MLVRRPFHALVLLGCVVLATPLHAQTPKTFPTPARTARVPSGCRTVGSTDPVLASRAAWRNLHADEVNTDEVSIAYASLCKLATKIAL